MLVREDGSWSREIRAGKVISIGALQGIPIWNELGGLQLLFMMPIHGKGVIVTKSGRRQAGAFLLQAGESLSLKSPVTAMGTYEFRTLPMIGIRVGKGAVCAFCRSPLKKKAVGCLVPVLGGALKGKALCKACAQAWVAPTGDQRADAEEARQ
jgi:hypothetical protein